MHLLGANKTEKAIDWVSQATEGVGKIVDVFEAHAQLQEGHPPTHTSCLLMMSARLWLICRRLSSAHKYLDNPTSHLWKFHHTY